MKTQYIKGTDGNLLAVLPAEELEKLYSELNSYKETAHLLSSEANRKRLSKSIENIENSVLHKRPNSTTKYDLDTLLQEHSNNPQKSVWGNKAVGKEIL